MDTGIRFRTIAFFVFLCFCNYIVLLEYVNLALEHHVCLGCFPNLVMQRSRYR
jgi:hypothetical protein